MGIWLGQELAAAGVIQLVQQVDDGRCVDFQLLQCHAGDGQSYLEGTLGLLRHLDKRVQGGDIGAFGHVVHAGFVGIVVVVVVVVTDVEETVTFQMDNLVYLEIKTNRSHCFKVVFD